MENNMTEQKRTDTTTANARSVPHDGGGSGGPHSAAEAAQVFAQADQSSKDDAHTASGSGGLRNGGVTSGGMDMMQSAGTIGGGAVSATRGVLREAIDATEDVASELVNGVAHVATDIVHGVRDVGMEVRDGASGLIGAAGTVGGAAVHTVANLLVDFVGSVRHVIGAAVGQQSGTTGALQSDADHDGTSPMTTRPARSSDTSRPAAS